MVVVTKFCAKIENQLKQLIAYRDIKTIEHKIRRYWMNKLLPKAGELTSQAAVGCYLL